MQYMSAMSLLSLLQARSKFRSVTIRALLSGTTYNASVTSLLASGCLHCELFLEHWVAVKQGSGEQHIVRMIVQVKG